MKRKSIFLVFLFVLTLGFLASAMADDCEDTSKIGDSEKKFSVVLSNVSGMEPQSFNDIGCAVISRNGECATRQSMFDGGAVTYDYQSGEQLPVEKAYFAMKTDVKTPKGFGIVAFKDKAEAEKFSAAHGKGKIVKWFEIVDEKLK
jgi:hypothetical protein